jgi:hypothetical protein
VQDSITTSEITIASEYSSNQADTSNTLDFTSVTDIESSTICMYYSNYKAPFVFLTIDVTIG